MTQIATMSKDVYKEFHQRAYHPDVTQVYVNYVSRHNTHSNIENNDKVAFVGLQYFLKEYLGNQWSQFFSASKEDAVRNHKRILSAMLGYPVSVVYLEKLHDLGYLPLRIKALPEGVMVPYGVPPVTITNTVPGFQWLPNMIETVFSCENWFTQTSATTAAAYKRTFDKYAELTGADPSFTAFQGHDFSMRGMPGVQAAAMSGFGHLAAGFVGTDTIPAVLFAEKYYGADVDSELVGCSVDATEHSVTCSWIDEGEIEFFRYLMTEQSPTGILSVVSDTWDFWKLVTEYLPQLKSEILARDGKVVIRPDSGDPVDILCGDNLVSTIGKPEHKGLIQCLWDIFGGHVNEAGYKVLDPHIGAIYGDAITLERQEQILSKLAAAGFCSSNVVLGIGSYTYQYVTRDTHGSAVKATSVVKNGERTAIYKDPKTDAKKKSLKGLVKVDWDIDTQQYVVFDDVTEEQEAEGSLSVVWEDGELIGETTLAAIRTNMVSFNSI